MRNELKHIEEIENYLLNKLNSADKINFERKMEMNPALQTEVEIQKSIAENIALKAFAADINKFHQTFITQETISGSTFFGKWFLNTILAIIITGISALSIYYFANGNKFSNLKTEEKAVENKIPVNQSPDTKHENNRKDSVLKRKTIPTYSSATMIPAGPLYTKSGSDFTNDFSSSPQIIDEDVLKKIQIPFEEITMNAQEGKEFFTAKSHSRIAFPAGILQHQDGSKVEGEVTIRYREFRNPAEMAFSGIPMEHEQNGEKFQMNSAGMIEVRCVQNGEELKIGKNNYFTMDYRVTDNLDSCYFWSLNDQTKKWKCKDTLQYGNPNPEIPEEYPYGMVIGKLFDAYSGDTMFYSKIKFTAIGDLNSKEYTAFFNDTGFIVPKMEPGQYLATFTKKGYNSFQFNGVYVTKGQMSELIIHMKPKKKYHAYVDDIIINTFDKNAFNRKLKKVNAKGTFKTFNDIPENLKGEYAMTESTSEMIYEDGSKKVIRMNRKEATARNNQRPKFTITNPTNEEKTAMKNNAIFNSTVFGLQCEGFGVYNCDQIKRLNNPVKVRPSFGNTELSDKNQNKQMVVIDKNINTVFTFYGNEFSISKNGRNCLLIYSNGKIFGIRENDFSSLKISGNGEYYIPVTDITSQIHSTEDLKKFLEF
jgi:hypothetical protein